MAAFLNQLALSFDLPILDWIQANLQSPLMDKIMPIITLFGEGGVFWIAWAVLMLILPKTRKIGISMLFALILGLLVCNITLKPLVARIRPYDLQAQLGVTINLLIKEQSDFSFPSGHTIASFEAAVVLLKYSLPSSALQYPAEMVLSAYPLPSRDRNVSISKASVMAATHSSAVMPMLSSALSYCSRV